MREIGLSLAGLGFLHLTRRKMTLELGRLVRRLGGGQREFVWLWSAIFLPGTLIHEVSHFLAAALTGARTGKIEIFPEMDKKTVHLGYVQTQQLNPIRGFLVGSAPLIIGLALLVWISTGLDYRLPITGHRLLAFYLFFTIANSLFPSWSDVKQTLPLIAIGIIAGGILWASGIQMKIGPESPIWDMAQSLSGALWISVGINFAIVALLGIANRLLGGKK